MHDASADSKNKQKEEKDTKGRSCIESYEVGNQVLLNAKNLPTNVVFAVFKTKLLPRHWTSYGRDQEGTCVYAQPSTQIAHTSVVLRGLA